MKGFANRAKDVYVLAESEGGDLQSRSLKTGARNRRDAETTLSEPLPIP